MRIVSYLIISAVFLMIGLSSLNSLHLIEKKEVVLFQPQMPDFSNRYLLEPIVNLIVADIHS